MTKFNITQYNPQERAYGPIAAVVDDNTDTGFYSLEQYAEGLAEALTEHVGSPTKLFVAVRLDD